MSPICALKIILQEIVINTMEYDSATRKDEHLPFASTWMELEGIVLSERSQAEKDNYHMVSLICGI